MNHPRLFAIMPFVGMFESAAYLEVRQHTSIVFGLDEELLAAAGAQFKAIPLQDEGLPGDSVEYECQSRDFLHFLLEKRCVFDVVLIDGVHTFEHALNDLMCAISLLSERGVAIVDDVLPNSYDASLPDFLEVARLRGAAPEAGVHWFADGSWMGDVYKIPFFISSFMPHLSFATAETPPGQLVVWREPRAAAAIPKRTFRDISDLDFRDTIIRRAELNLMTIYQIVGRVANRLGKPTPVKDARLSLRDEEIVWSMEVPGRSMSPPRVSYEELMSPLVRESSKQLWNAPRLAKTVASFRLRNVFVAGDGLVFDTNGNVIQETVEQYSDEDIIYWRHQLHKVLRNGEYRRCQETALLCGKIGLSNYGHWMIEMLPRAYLMRDNIIKDDWKVFIPTVHTLMRQVIFDSLALLGISAASVIENRSEPVWFNELVVVTGLTKHGEYYLPLTTECLSEVAAGIPAQPGERVWVSRIGEPRSLAREEELQHLLVAQGWRILVPSGMTLYDQIAASKGVRHMAGVDGAGLTNTGFMSAGGRVTSFIPAIMPDMFFWSIAQNLDLNYHEVRCGIGTVQEGAIPWNASLLIEPSDAMRLLA